MVIFGLLLLLFAVLIVIAAVAHGGDPASLDLQLFTIKTNVTGVFVAGAVTLLLAVLGLALVLWGVRSDRRHRGQIKELRKRASRRDRGEPQPAAAPPPQRPQGPAAGQPEGRSAAGSSAGGSSAGASTPGSSGRPSGSGSGPSGSGSTNSSTEPPASGGTVRRDGPDEYFESAPRDSGT